MLMKPNCLFLLLLHCVLPWCGGCSGQSDTGRLPRHISIAETELSHSRTIHGETASGAMVSLSVRPYCGNQTGFWGSETSPPVDLLWDLSFVVDDQHISIPKELLRDLANVLLSPHTRTIEAYLSVNTERLSIDKHGDGYEVRLNAGDGGNSYQATFEITTTELGGAVIKRRIRYLSKGIWG